MSRAENPPQFFRGGRLLQEYVIDAHGKFESQQPHLIKMEQKSLCPFHYAVLPYADILLAAQAVDQLDKGKSFRSQQAHSLIWVPLQMTFFGLACCTHLSVDGERKDAYDDGFGYPLPLPLCPPKASVADILFFIFRNSCRHILMFKFPFRRCALA